MPKFNVVTWSVEDISKFLFYTKSKNDRNTIQNSGIMIEI